MAFRCVLLARDFSFCVHWDDLYDGINSDMYRRRNADLQRCRLRDRWQRRRLRGIHRRGGPQHFGYGHYCQLPMLLIHNAVAEEIAKPPRTQGLGVCQEMCFWVSYLTPTVPKEVNLKPTALTAHVYPQRRRVLFLIHGLRTTLCMLLADSFTYVSPFSPSSLSSYTQTQ